MHLLWVLVAALAVPALLVLLGLPFTLPMYFRERRQTNRRKRLYADSFLHDLGSDDEHEPSKPDRG